jgi:hypothetical protein
MKNIIKLLFISILIFTSCSKDQVEENKYSGQEFVSFDNINSVEFSILENQINGGSLKVLLSREMPENVVVTIDVQAVSSNVGYTIPTPTVTIPAGQIEGSFKIIPINDNVNSLSTVLNVTIKSTSNNLKVGLREVGSYSKKVVIVNDDCPTKFSNWFGAISVEDVGYPPALAATGSGNASGDCDLLRVVAATNLVGWTTGAIANASHIFKFLPSTPGSTSGTIELQPVLIGTGNFNFPGAPATPGEVFYEITFGEYNESTNIIEVDYRLRVKQVSTGTFFNLNGWTGTNRIIKL